MNKKYIHKRFFVNLGLGVGTLTSLILLIYEISRSTLLTTEVLYFCISSGLFAAILLGLLLSLFFRPRNKRINKIETENLSDGETIIIEGAANIFSNNQKKGGKLFLTNRRLIFRHYLQETELDQNSYSLDLIQDVEKILYAGLINTGVKIVLKETAVSFSLDYSGDWKSIIEKQVFNPEKINKIITT